MIIREEKIRHLFRLIIIAGEPPFVMILFSLCENLTYILYSLDKVFI